ncbi:sulfotransferase family cytosolic 1B member 1-like isoform X2 [Pomacea canaliculata]|uniref:sulfotransferase family cytosolic 1B member 1-like isoform X2 n=1 Tax=Pomacea canaliculata TaxID=400727 RepID=UPI000D73FB93|nr:sulfotransferase family cytosolic 1B member 1-like isoform X2 [Pomacea canaliculata]
MDTVCIKDKFGNVRWFLGEDIRLPPIIENQSLADRLSFINNFDLRPDDVIIAGYMRSGNNWLHQMIYMLLEGTLDPPPLFGSDSNVNLEFATDTRQVLPPVKPRALYTHLLFKDLPKVVTEKKVKVVHITRNLKDVFVSFYCLAEKFPLRPYYPPWPEFLSTMLDDGVWYGDVFDHVTSWEKAIDDHPEHPFYCVTYEELTQNGVDQLENIDQFLETNRGRPFCQTVVEKCHINNMANLRLARDTESDWTMIFRKGVVGDWKNWFTVAQNEEFEEVTFASDSLIKVCKSLPHTDDLSLLYYNEHSRQ